jgi:hypothetical protein
MNPLETAGSSALGHPQREIIRIKAAAAMEPGKLRVAGYARVSSDSEGSAQFIFRASTVLHQAD